MGGDKIQWQSTEFETFKVWKQVDFNMTSETPTKLGGLEIIDTNKDGNYDKGVDKVVRRDDKGQEIALNLNSKEVKEFEKKYKIDLHSKRQFNLSGAENYSKNLDKARSYADQGLVEKTIESLTQAHQAALSSNLPIDGKLEASLLLDAKKAGVAVAMARAEIAVENGFFTAANHNLDNAKSWAEDVAFAQGRNNPDPKLYNASRATELRKTAYQKEIQSNVESAKATAAKLSRKMYQEKAIALVFEAKDKFGLVVTVEMLLGDHQGQSDVSKYMDILATSPGKFHQGQSDVSKYMDVLATSPGTAKKKKDLRIQAQNMAAYSPSAWDNLRLAEDAAKLGDVEGVKKYLSNNPGGPFDQEKAIDLIQSAQTIKQGREDFINALENYLPMKWW